MCNVCGRLDFYILCNSLYWKQYWSFLIIDTSRRNELLKPLGFGPLVEIINQQ